METKYRFNEARHLHQIEVEGEWKNLTGCTTVLSVVAKPALIGWAAKMATEYVRSNIGKFDLTDKEQFEQLLEEAKKAHCKRKTEAGSWGTKTHEDISNLIERAIKDNEGYILKDILNSSDIIATQSFIKWAQDNEVKFLATEKNIYSEKLFVGGIVDFVCEIDGKRWIGDIKTSGSGIYPEHFWQCAGYDLMLQEMGEPKADGYLILNPKENGEFNEKRSISNGDNTKAFLACLDIYRIQEKIKNQII